MFPAFAASMQFTTIVMDSGKNMTKNSALTMHRGTALDHKTLRLALLGTP